MYRWFDVYSNFYEDFKPFYAMVWCLSFPHRFHHVIIVCYINYVTAITSWWWLLLYQFVAKISISCSIRFTHRLLLHWSVHCICTLSQLLHCTDNACCWICFRFCACRCSNCTYACTVLCQFRNAIKVLVLLQNKNNGVALKS